MDELRTKVAAEIRDALIAGCTEKADFPERLAALILTIPEIAEALKAKRREETVYRSGQPTPPDAS